MGILRPRGLAKSWLLVRVPESLFEPRSFCSWNPHSFHVAPCLHPSDFFYVLSLWGSLSKLHVKNLTFVKYMNSSFAAPLLLAPPEHVDHIIPFTALPVFPQARLPSPPTTGLPLSTHSCIELPSRLQYPDDLFLKLKKCGRTLEDTICRVENREVSVHGEKVFWEPRIQDGNNEGTHFHIHHLSQ